MNDRMTEPTRPHDRPRNGNSPRKSGLRGMVLAVLLAFVLGAGAAAWIAWRTGWIATDQDTAAPQTKAGAANDGDGAGNTAPAMAAGPGAGVPIDLRLNALERRLNRIDLQAEAASGNAARAEGLLIAFAARRLIERGERLGYLGDQLRLRFGNAQPNAVRTILATARDPVTLEQLRQGLENLPQETVEKPRDLNGWERVKAELGDLFVLRRASAPSPRPERRLERASRLLDEGRVASARALVASLPNAERAEGWLRDARRYVAAREALDLIETAALLEPRNLNDGSGQPVRQLSPASPAGADAPVDEDGASEGQDAPSRTAEPAA